MHRCRALIQEQHADLAHLALNDFGEGWDNRLFRLGDELIVRVLALGVAYLASSRDDELMSALGRATIDAALSNKP